jgi:hypothetical protein
VAAAGHPGVHPYEDFVLYAEPTDADAKRLLRRGTRHDRARRTLQRLLRTSPR